jgi:hypothetical protein
LEYFPAILAVWYSLCSFGIFFVILVCSDQEKSGNPGLRSRTSEARPWHPN